MPLRGGSWRSDSLIALLKENKALTPVNRALTAIYLIANDGPNVHRIMRVKRIQRAGIAATLAGRCQCQSGHNPIK